MPDLRFVPRMAIKKKQDNNADALTVVFFNFPLRRHFVH